jgi:hypothetical protein
MRFARRLWIAAACMLALVAAPAVRAQAMKILPPDTEMVVTVNIQQILNSEVLKANKTLVDLAKAKINEQLDDKEIGKYLKKANFDVFKDLSSVVVAMPGNRDTDDGFIVLTGKFDADKIETAVLEASKEAGADVKVKSVKIANTPAWEVTPKDEKTMYVGILDKKTMLACTSKADFAEAVARFNGTKTSTFKDAAFKNLVQTTSAKQSLSFVATGKLLNKLAEKNPNAGNENAKMAMAMLQQVDGFSAAITIEKNIDFQLAMNAKDTDTANQFAAAANIGLQGIKQTVMKQAKMNEKMEPVLDILNTLKAEAKGSNLIIRGQITFATLEKLMQSLPNP